MTPWNAASLWRETIPEARDARLAQLLITGGAGFIGSHTCLVLLEAGHQLVVLDDFSNSSPEALRRVLELAGLPPGDPRLQTISGDIRSTAALVWP